MIKLKLFDFLKVSTNNEKLFNIMMALNELKHFGMSSAELLD